MLQGLFPYRVNEEALASQADLSIVAMSLSFAASYMKIVPMYYFSLVLCLLSLANFTYTFPKSKNVKLQHSGGEVVLGRALGRDDSRSIFEYLQVAACIFYNIMQLYLHYKVVSLEQVKL
ncbi:hypothetical protein MIR68_004613 [Amoeboaphelidium protococcarum]|nr:hypothetical protein MIR68_004613 [Amoeboaphelidium protococcarum]